MIAVLYSDLSLTSLIHNFLRIFPSTCVCLSHFYTSESALHSKLICQKISEIHTNYMDGFGDYSLNFKWQYADLEYFLFYIRTV